MSFVMENNENKITKMRAYFKELSIRLAKEYTAKISQRATNLFREIMQDSSFELTWSEDYEIITYKNGQKLTFDLLSGGQQVSAAISIRLSLLQELSNISFAFFYHHYFYYIYLYYIIIQLTYYKIQMNLLNQNYLYIIKVLN